MLIICPNCKGFKRKGNKCEKSARKVQKVQKGVEFRSFSKKATKTARRAIKSTVGKMVISKGLEQLFSLYQKGASCRKNKRVRTLFNSDVANNLIRNGSNKLNSKMYVK